MPPLTSSVEFLRSEEVHVWRIALDLPAASLESLFRTLSADEKARAAKFHFPQVRDRFSAARGVLRTLLGTYLQKRPEEVRFGYGKGGKPCLIDPVEAELEFNLSHSKGEALIALCRKRHVGIDLEWVDESLDFAAIAHRHFSADEIAALESLPTFTRRQGFYECWTRKEAYLKARGDGFAHGLQDFSVSIGSGVRPSLLADHRDSQAVSQWSLHALETLPGFIGSLAVHGNDLTVLQYEHSTPTTR